MTEFTEYNENGQWAIATLASDKVQEILDAGEGIDVTIQINGVEVDFEEIMDSMAGQWDWAVNKRAKEIVEEKFGDKFYELYDAIDEVKSRVKTIFNVEV